MAFSDLERQQIERDLSRFMEKHRPPAHLRAKVDLGYKVHGQSVDIFEIRPYWQDHSVKIESPIAKATFVRTQNCWRIFWMRADMKWHGYDPDSRVGSFETFLAVVSRDAYGCFFG